MALTIGALPVTAMAEGTGDLCIDEPLAVVENNKDWYVSSTDYYYKDGITYYYYELDDGTIAIGGCDGTESAVSIPSEIYGKSVSAIGNTAFKYYSGTLTNIILPNSVKTIDAFAFSNSKYLRSVTIPDGVVTIGKYAFSNCPNLTSVTIPDSVTGMLEETFSGCTGLKSVKIGNGINNIGKYAFRDCESLTNITIPDSVTSIGDRAFENCSSLPSVTIPGSATSIGNYAFCDCTSLTSITIPDGVTSISERAFCNCTSLTSVNIPDSVVSIGSGAFLKCSSLKTVFIPDSVTSIGTAIFSLCTSLKSVSLPNSIDTIGSYMFNGCESLTDVYYYGTEAEWNEMTIEENNDSLANATIHFGCKDTLAKTTSFVERLYTTMLARSSDPTGKANHISSLMNGKTAAEIGAKFVLSTELKNKKLTNREFVKRMYQTFLDRTPSSNEITRWAKTLDNGCTYEYILGRFVASAEFKKLATNYGITAGTYTPTQNRDQNENVTAFVSRMFTKALKRNYDVTGLNNHTGRILNKTHTPAQIANLFFFSTELKNKNLSDEEFVTRLYNALFDRNPDAKGKANWLTKMKNGYTREKVFDGFAASAEFKNLVASFGL